MPELVIHKLADWGAKEIFVLREDLLPLACGGNKVRIVLKLIADAKLKGATDVVGYGNSRSNLCRVLAMLCSREGLGCVIVSPPDDDGSRVETSNSRIVRLCGAEIVPCGKAAAVAEAVESTLAKVVSAGGRPYYIFGDRFGKGNEKVLMSAYEEVARALCGWQDGNGIAFDRISLAVGTGSTYAGLLSGLRSCGNQTPVTGFTIARGKERSVSAIREFTDLPVDIRDDALCGGYGLASAEELAFLSGMLRSTAVVFDPVYAGKALWGLYWLVQEGDAGPGRILFVHSGSLPLAIDAMAGLRGDGGD